MRLYVCMYVCMSYMYVMYVMILVQVDHVVLFDFPQEPSEYVRRVGRTGRAGMHTNMPYSYELAYAQIYIYLSVSISMCGAGRVGRATVLVYGRQVSIARSILASSRGGARIEPVPSENAMQSWNKG